VKELLHETLIAIGYFSLQNEKGQQILFKGEQPILTIMCNNVPFTYFMDKKLKEILFPTLIAASYRSERALAIMNQEIDLNMLIKYLNENTKEELPKIVEEEHEYMSMSSLTGGTGTEHKTVRSPSLSSTNSSQCSM
jgi:hypothetical protein